MPLGSKSYELAVSPCRLRTHPYFDNLDKEDVYPGSDDDLDDEESALAEHNATVAEIEEKIRALEESTREQTEENLRRRMVLMQKQTELIRSLNAVLHAMVR